MRNAKHLLSLAIAALIAAPLAPATALADNDYAPTLTPTAEPTPPPVDVTGAGGNPLMQGRGAMRGGGQGGFQGGGRRMKGGGGKRGGAGRQRMMARFDTNGDGVLDDNEKQALRQFRAAHGKGGGGGGGGGGASSNAPTVGNHYNGFPGTAAGISNGLGGAPGGAGGVGGANLARGGGGGNGGGMNKEARRQKLIQRFDTNGDGKLDGNEQAAADAFRAQRRQQKMMKMQQGAAAGPGVTP